MAGLAAARQLQSFGMETVVLEARVGDVTLPTLTRFCYEIFVHGSNNQYHMKD